MSSDFDLLKKKEIHYYRELTSKRKAFAPIVIFIKRVIRKMFSFIGMPLVSEINEYHRYLADILQKDISAIHLRLEAMSQAVSERKGDGGKGVVPANADEVHVVYDTKFETAYDLAALRTSVNQELAAIRPKLDRLRLLHDQQRFDDLPSLQRYVQTLHEELKAFEALILAQHKSKYGTVDDSTLHKGYLYSAVARRQDLLAFENWAIEMSIDYSHMNRAYWQYVFVAQALFERGMLRNGKSGLGFAVGTELLPALFARFGAKIMATDLNDNHPQAEIWSSIGARSESLSMLEHPEVCDKDTFYQNVSFMPLDMNNIPDNIKDFDFCWSNCAFEHLGSEKLGREFIINTLNVLKPGGVSVHTTEFHLAGDESIDEIPYCTLFGKNFFDSLRDEITSMGHYFAPLDYRLGNHPEDDYVYWLDQPAAQHFKLSVDGHLSTSIGIIIIKNANQDGASVGASHAENKATSQSHEVFALNQYKLTHGVIDDSETISQPLISSIANRRDFFAFSDWLHQMRLDASFIHRKYWEWAFIAQVLFERNMLKPDRKGIGFAVGSEPLPALFAKYGARITATDLSENNPQAENWKAGNQHATNLHALERPCVCDIKVFYENVKFLPIDMNAIPGDLNHYDFCWSSCALEHLGSVRQGREFILNTLSILKPGGVSVHTTEFNLSEDVNVDLPNSAVFSKTFFEDMRNDVISMGHYFAPFDFRLGSHPDEDYIFKFENTEPHFKVLIADNISTSIGFIIVKG